MLSLFGIVLAIGIVVDDAIVVVENVSRHIADGLSSRDAAVKAMSEITGPVIATTLVLLAVFVPCAFMPGITGELFRQFALTISASVIISTINALTLSPALCAIFLRPPTETKFIGFRLFNQAFDRTTAVYGATVARLVRLTLIVSIASIALVMATGWILTQLPTGFVPDEDQGVLFVNIQLPDAASKERTDEVVKNLDQVFEQTPGVRGWLSVTGYSLLGGSGGPNVGFSVLVLKPWEDRDAKTERQFASEQRAILFTFAPPPIDGLGTAGGFQMEVQDRGSNGYLPLQNATEELVANASTQSSLAALNSSFRATVPQLYVDVDREKAKTMNIPLSSVFATLQASLGSSYINDFTLNNRSYQVRAQAEAPFRRSASDITQLDVRDSNGNMVPLGSIVTVRDDFGPGQRFRSTGRQLRYRARVNGTNRRSNLARFILL